MKSTFPSRWVPAASVGRVGVSLVLSLSAITPARGQGVTVLTEDTLPVVRFGVSGAPGLGSVFSVDFGFATNEAELPGQLHDSLTLILTGFLDGKERVLATMDVFGLTPKPLVDGAGDFSATPVEFVNASLDPLTGFEFPRKQALNLSFSLPADWLGTGELTGFLVSNGDALKSVGFVGQPLVVPEPGPVGLLGVGMGMGVGMGLLAGAGRRAWRAQR